MDQGVEVDMQFESEPSWYNAGDQQVPGPNYYGVEGEEMDSYGGPGGKGPKLNYINRPYLDNSRGNPGFNQGGGKGQQQHRLEHSNHSQRSQNSGNSGHSGGATHSRGRGGYAKHHHHQHSV